MSVLNLSTEVKPMCRLGAGAADDVLLQALIDGAEEWAQEVTGCKFGEVTLTEHVDGGMRTLPLRWGPCVAVLSVYDTEAEESVDADAYAVRDGVIYNADGGGCVSPFRWPCGERRYRVQYVAGYYVAGGSTTTTAGVTIDRQAFPAGLKLALLQLVFRAYMARGGVSSESAAGWSANWAELAGSDVMAVLGGYRRLGV